MSRPDLELPRGDYAFLGMLLLAPMSPYQIKKAMEGSISHFYSAAHSQVYQQAGRLVRDGFVKEKDAPGGRRKRILSLTPKGRRVVMAWLKSTEADDQLYSELLVKVFFANHVDDPEGLRTMLERRREESEAMLHDYEKFLPMLEAATENPYPAMTLSYGIHAYRAEIAWIDETLAKLSSGGTPPRRRSG